MHRMARTATKPRRLTTVDIREERVSGFAPLVEGKPRIDRDKGIIYGVKVVGRSSPNTHGVQGVEGTDYTREALESELPQIEGINVNTDHPPRDNAGQVRSVRDRFAWISEARIADDCIFGDMHFLDPKDPLAIRIMNAAESKPDAFALSHNALGKGDVKNRRFVIQEVIVRSVDIVTAGGTNRSLFESREDMPKLKIRKLFEAAGPRTKVSPKKFPNLAKAVKRLLEDDEYGVMDQESEGEAPADHEEALKEGFRASVAHIVDACLSGEDDPKECIKRIGELLKTHDKLSDDSGDEEDLEEEDDSGDKKPKEDDKKEDEPDEPKKVEESRRHCTRLAKGYLQLQENQQPAKSLVEALVKLPDEDARLSLLESWPRGTAPTPSSGKGGSAPRSSSPGRPIQESAAPKDAEEQAKLLLR